MPRSETDDVYKTDSLQLKCSGSWFWISLMMMVAAPDICWHVLDCIRIFKHYMCIMLDQFIDNKHKDVQ